MLTREQTDQFVSLIQQQQKVEVEKSLAIQNRNHKAVRYLDEVTQKIRQQKNTILLAQAA